jgi:hypothetical protein
LWRFLGADLRPLACALALVLFAVIEPGPAAKADQSTPQGDQSSKPAEPGPKRIPPITLSKKTTVLMAPLDVEGNVDYLAALNDRVSQGVTPENNAAVLLVRAWGAKEFEPRERLRFYRLLGIEPPPDGARFLSEFPTVVVKELGRSPTKPEWADFDRARHEAWLSNSMPLVHTWLKANAGPLDLVVAATRRSQCYLPLVEPPGAGLQGMPLPGADASRAAARLLLARAMLRLGEGKTKEAEEDLLACHRLGRLYGRTPFAMPVLAAIAIDSMACQGDMQLIACGNLSAERALAYQEALRKLPPQPAMVDVIDRGERYIFLDTVSQLARLGAAHAGVAAPPRGQFADLLKALPHGPALNWDDALVFGNEHFDKVVAAARKPTLAERKAAFAKLDQENRALAAEVKGDALGASFLFSALRKDLGRRLAKSLTMLLLPAEETCFEAEGRSQAREALEQVAFALAAYRADHHAFPASLNELPPKYLAHLPQDPFSAQPLHYQKQAAGFLLYSVGPNGVDDGGRTHDSQPRGDDVVFRVSPCAASPAPR